VQYLIHEMIVLLQDVVEVLERSHFPSFGKSFVCFKGIGRLRISCPQNSQLNIGISRLSCDFICNDIVVGSVKKLASTC
jgi:hypothetical protein